MGIRGVWPPDRRVMPLLDRTWVRLLALCAMVLGAVALATVVDLPSIAAVRAWIDDVGPISWVGLVLGLAVALATPLPRSGLSVLIGAVAGFSAGLAVVVGGSVLGALAGYGLSRWLGRAAVVRLAGVRWERMEQVLDRRGVLTVVTARVMPVVPFVAVSYAAGLAGLRLGAYTVGTAVGVLPGSVAYVAIGASSAALTVWTPSAPVWSTVLVLVLVLLSGLALGTRLRRLRRAPQS
jgi:uncharacterized membrane protein YdjX (TVP38/TMEM64 family)